MSKSICLGNDRVLIALDDFGQLYDCYYPYVGLENHTMGRFTHKIGFWVNKNGDKKFSWLDSGEWQIKVSYQEDAMATKIIAKNSRLELEVSFEDVVYNEKDIFIRNLEITNCALEDQKVRVFFNQQFNIYESFRGDTAIYDHQEKVIIHYKGDRAFLINAHTEFNPNFDDYSVGLFEIEGKEGTYKDAEDGELAKNNVDHGLVDSTIGLHLDLKSKQAGKLSYWMIMDKTISKCKELNAYVLERGAKNIAKSTVNYWKAWINKNKIDFGSLSKKYIDLLKQSLLIVETHAGGNGAIIASGDSHLLKMGRGSYSYIWTRDGAMIILPLIEAGYYHTPKNFFKFCAKVVTEEGFMLHKYRADTTLGSSWHPYVRGCQTELPIQEDETALVVYAFWQYYKETKDLEFVEQNYDRLIRNPAKFMVEYIDDTYFLPKSTYDLWEEKFGISTFTVATVYAALVAASNFARVLGKTNEEHLYLSTAQKIKQSLIKHLWIEKEGLFVKLVNLGRNELFYDKTIDISSLHGLLEFGVLEAEDPKIQRFVALIEDRIACKNDVGGICRYQDDYYFRVSYDTPGNPWIITCLWLARYYIKKANSLKDLEPAYYWIDWVIAHAQPSGVLSEQINPLTGLQMSATPLIWSQSEYIKTILDLSKKEAELK